DCLEVCDRDGLCSDLFTLLFFFFFSSRRRHTRLVSDWSSDVCSSDLYKGRVALYEVMPFSDPLKELVLQGASAAEIKAEMIKQGMKSLRMSGISRVLEGTSSADEVARVSAAD